MAPWDTNMPLRSGVMTPTGVCLTVAFVAVGLYALYLRLLPKPLPGIAYNPEATKSLFGDAPDMIREIGGTGELGLWLAKQVDKMRSPVCQIFVRPFSKPWVLLADFRESQDILMRRKEFDKPTFVSDALEPLGDFHAKYKTNSVFKARRQLKQDLMTPNFLNNFMGPFMHSKGLELVKLLETKMDLAKGRPFSVIVDFDYAALDVMVKYAFGGNLVESALGPQVELVTQLDISEVPDGDWDQPVTFPKAPISPFLEAVEHAPEVFEKTTTSWTPRLSHWWWKQQSWYKKILSEKSRCVPPQVTRALENYRAGEVTTAMEHILRREQSTAEKQGREPQFDSQIMVDEIFADLIAGHHTTGGSMGWITKFLTGYPHVQSKLRSALYSALAEAVAETRFPTFDELRHARIPYLEAVIEEMLRLTPFTMTRETTCDTEILGHMVPKGYQVFMVNFGPGYLSPSIPVDDTQRSPTSRAAKVPGSWDETKDLRIFDPERWLVQKGDGGVEFDSAAGPQLNFGMGIRQCWGRKMAHLEMRTIMALVIWHFELKEIPESLGGYGGSDGITRQPHRVFVRLGRAVS